MSGVADLIADMVRAGVDPELIGRTAATIADAAKPADLQAERRREKDRERKRLRNSAESAECQNSPPDKEKSPPATPPKEINPPTDDRASAEVDLAADAFNETAEEVGWQTIRKLSPPRRRSLARRLDEVGGVDGWRVVLARARGSPFLCGENPKGWRLTFDWLLKPENMNKVIEGNYDQRSPKHQPTAGRKPESGLDAIGRHMAERRARKAEARQREAGAAGGIGTVPGDEAGGGVDPPRIALVASGPG